MAITVSNAVTGGTEASGAVSSLAATAFAATTGNLIVAFMRHFGGTVTGVSDTAGNTYSKVVAASNGGSGHNKVETYVAQNITGNASNVVTAAGTSMTFTSLHVLEISGLATSNAVDAADYNQSASNGTAITSNAFSTAQASEIVVSLATCNNGTDLSAEKVGGVAATVATSIGAPANTVSFYLVESATQSGIVDITTAGGATPWDIATVSFAVAGIGGSSFTGFIPQRMPIGV